VADPIAVYGAATGTAGALGAVWAIYHSAFRDKPKVSVELGREFRPPGEDSAYTILSPTPSSWPQTERLHPTAEKRAYVRVTNSGRRVLTVLEAGLEFSDGTRAVFRPGRSVQLGEGETDVSSVTEKGLRRMLQEKGIAESAYAAEASGQVHRKKVSRALRDWLGGLVPPEVMNP